MIVSLVFLGDDDSKNFEKHLSEFLSSQMTALDEDDLNPNSTATTDDQLTYKDFSFKSRRQYVWNESLDVGAPVYADRAYTWIHLPRVFLRQKYIACPCDDFAIKTDSLISFVAPKSLLVFVFLEASTVDKMTKLPAWIRNGDYKRLLVNGIARKDLKGF
jgi:hypothetical protein